MSDSLSSALLVWYDQSARVLPWRSDSTPYHIWVSEMMLQQTQVDTVLPYYQGFMSLFPDVFSLASAPQADVLKAWEGLGYYSRARNLHRAAQKVVAEYSGQLPQDLAQLRQLPGIGRYTAGAIASIAFDQPEPALDGNIRRIFARLLNARHPLGTPASDAELWDAARKHLPARRAGDFNQALMDLGASICLPKAPNCPACPLRDFCQAFALGAQKELPVKKAKKPVPEYIVTAAVIAVEGRVLIQQRPQGGLLGGMWEFPGGKLEPSDAGLEDCLQREIREELGLAIQVGAGFGVYKHAYTHFRITLHAFCCALLPGETLDLSAYPQARWVIPPELAAYAMGKVDRQIANRLLKTTPSTPN